MLACWSPLVRASLISFALLLGCGTRTTELFSDSADARSASVLWLDARGGISLEAGRVARWEDRSPSRNHLSQPDFTLRPVLSAPAGLASAVAFEGSQSLRSERGVDFPSSYTLFLIASRNDESDMGEVFSMQVQGHVVRLRTSADAGVSFASGVHDTTLQRAFPQQAPALFSLVGSAAGTRLRINGAQAAFDTFAFVPAAYGPARVGNGFTGDVVALALFDHALADDAVAALEAQLAAEWGIY